MLDQVWDRDGASGRADDLLGYVKIPIVEPAANDLETKLLGDRATGTNQYHIIPCRFNYS